MKRYYVDNKERKCWGNNSEFYGYKCVYIIYLYNSE